MPTIPTRNECGDRRPQLWTQNFLLMNALIFMVTSSCRSAVACVRSSLPHLKVSTRMKMRTLSSSTAVAAFSVPQHYSPLIYHSLHCQKPDAISSVGLCKNTNHRSQKFHSSRLSMSTCELAPEKLRWKCDPSQFKFQSTADLVDSSEKNALEKVEGPLGRRQVAKPLGQDRAEKAVEFGLTMPNHRGYNLYVLGPSGAGKRTMVQEQLNNIISSKTNNGAHFYDWCYVHNFDAADKPKTIRLLPGMGKELRTDIKMLTEEIQVAIPLALEDEEHLRRAREIEREIMSEHDRALSDLERDALKEDLKMIKTPNGIVLAGPASADKQPHERPLLLGGDSEDKDADEKNDSPVLTDEKKEELRKAMKLLQPRMHEIMNRVTKLQRLATKRVKEWNQDAARVTVDQLMMPLRFKYADLTEVLAHLDAIEKDIVEHSEEIRADDDQPPGDSMAAALLIARKPRLNLDRYNINLIVSHENEENDIKDDNTLGAFTTALTTSITAGNNVEQKKEKVRGPPIVYETHPHYHNLMGRIDHESHFGSLVTDFSQIKSGSIHRANGGYLILDARDVLMRPFSWQALKRCLQTSEARIDSLGDELSVISTTSLHPQPIPLDVKVIMLGDRYLYYMLQMYDPDFDGLFKVAADFNDDTDVSEESCAEYAHLIGSIVQVEGSGDESNEGTRKIRHFDPSAVGAMIEQSTREAGDQEKLSTRMRSVSDLVVESNYWASKDGSNIVKAEHVQKAIDEKIYRLDRVRELVHESIRRGTILVDVDGETVGQVNGLSVWKMSGEGVAFGRPSRITATARLGKGNVVDIEKETELGGPIHSKGVMILSSLLASRYARDFPLSLTASLVFEQSYGKVEGDSASVAEFCAILSVIADLPIRQDLAITGSLNQQGQAQPIGGVSEKIEGFYDVCHAAGLTNKQGVLIPSSNAKHLVLRPDVVDAVREGKFTVYTYDSVDDAIALLTGVPAGERDKETGEYPEGTVNYLVDRRLFEMADLLRKFSENSEKKEA